MRNMMVAALCCLLIAPVLLTGCGGKYADVEKINDEYVALVEEFSAGLEKAANAEETAKVMNRFADGMEKIWPKMQKMAEKYPELKNPANPPEELKESQERANAAGQKMAGAMMKMMKYMTDPAVRKAQERMGSIMKEK